MDRLRTPWIVAIGVTLGAAVTWLWLGAGVMSPVRRAVEPRLHTPHALEPAHLSLRPSVMRSPISSGPSERARPSIAVRAEATARDDSTYSRMLAVAVSRSDATEVMRKISETHERFVVTPDDPDWARQTEQALRDFFSARSANRSGGIEITSVSCRSAGCEVQAVVQMAVPGSDSAAAFTSGRSGLDPREVLHESSPVGASLKQEDYIGSDLGESDGISEGVGFIVWYRRLGRDPQATSSRPQ
jgi:hypothetical protein